MKKLLITSTSLLAFASAFGGAFVPGNLVVTQVGEDGRTTAASSSATQTYVKEFTTSGTLVQTIAFPSTGGGTKLTNSGTATAEGQLSYHNGYFALIGYNTPAGTATVARTDSPTVGRVVGIVDAAGNVDLSTVLTDAFSGDNTASNSGPRSAVTDGTNIWLAGSYGGAANTTGGARYATKGGTTSTQLATITGRVATIYGGKLYIGGSQGVNTFTTNLPTSSDTLSFVAGFPDPSIGPSVYDFAFVGSDTLYATDDRTTNTTTGATSTDNGVRKYTYDSNTSTWVLQYVIQAGLPTTSGGNSVGARSIAVDSSGVNNVIYVVSAQNTQSGIYKVVDTGASSTFSLVVASAANTAFRGVRLAAAASKTVSGTIDFDNGFNGVNQNNSTGFVIPVTFEVTDSNNTVVQTTTVNVTGNGGTSYSYSFNLNSGISGNVTIKADTPTHLVKKSAVLNANSSINTNFSLLNGDVDDDDVVSVFDYITLSDAFDTAFGDAGYVLNADLDKDGVISVFDYIILSDRFDTQGDRSN